MKHGSVVCLDTDIRRLWWGMSLSESLFLSQEYFYENCIRNSSSPDEKQTSGHPLPLFDASESSHG